MHMVHYDEEAADAGADRPYAVAGYIFEIDDSADEDPFLDYVMGSASRTDSMMGAYVPTSIYHYLGGLTTPTCDEVVNWFISATPIKIT